MKDCLTYSHNLFSAYLTLCILKMTSVNRKLLFSLYSDIAVIHAAKTLTLISDLIIKMPAFLKPNSPVFVSSQQSWNIVSAEKVFSLYAKWRINQRFWCGFDMGR